MTLPLPNGKGLFSPSTEGNERRTVPERMRRMSQPETSSTGGAQGDAPPPAHYKNVHKDCAVLCGHPNGPVFACGENLGNHSKISAQMVMSKTTPPDSWMGFTLRFPLGEGQERAEKDGFGVRYEGEPYIPYARYRESISLTGII